MIRFPGNSDDLSDSVISALVHDGAVFYNRISNFGNPTLVYDEPVDADGNIRRAFNISTASAMIALLERKGVEVQFLGDSNWVFNIDCMMAALRFKVPNKDDLIEQAAIKIAARKNSLKSKKEGEK